MLDDDKAKVVSIKVPIKVKTAIIPVNPKYNPKYFEDDYPILISTSPPLNLIHYEIADIADDFLEV